MKSAYNNIQEAIRILKKKWNLKDNITGSFKVEINDSESHSILDRIRDRTDISLNDMNSKLQLGVDLILKKESKGFFKKPISYIELTYKKSNFKVIFMIKPENKYLRVSSIFGIDFKTSNALYWDINEFIEINPEYKHSVKDFDFYTLDNSSEDQFFSVEVNERTKSYDVYLSDTNDIYELELDI